MLDNIWLAYELRPWEESAYLAFAEAQIDRLLKTKFRKVYKENSKFKPIIENLIKLETEIIKDGKKLFYKRGNPFLVKNNLLYYI